MKSLEKQLSIYKGIGPGFDFLRVALAISIVFFHAQLLTGNIWVRDSPLWFLEYALVPMFFALSGFLVTASGMRLSLKNFLINRGLRIIPALAVDVVVAAIIIGPLVTTRPLLQYFTDAKFFLYFLNITGYIHYELPGVFEDHFSKMVNGALWTVPYEIMCYIITSFFIISAFLKSAKKVIAFTLMMLLAGIVIDNSTIISSFSETVVKIFYLALVSRKAQIVTAFLFGVIFFQARGVIPYSKWIFFLALAFCLLATFESGPWLIESVAPRIILLPALAYITVFIGLTPIPIPNYFHRGDYSYGIYLYHDPLLQLVISIFPTIAMTKYTGGFFTLVVGIPFVLLLAKFSWHFIEKPILGLRKKFSFVAKVRGVDNINH